MSTSKSACDPLLSFLYGGAAADECENVCPESSSAVSIEGIHSDETVLERYVNYRSVNCVPYDIPHVLPNINLEIIYLLSMQVAWSIILAFVEEKIVFKTSKSLSDYS